MASLGRVGGLSEAEYADLEDRVDRFHAAWTPDAAADLEPFLPPPGTRHRPFVLVEIIKIDMERRAKGGLAIRVESYLSRFSRDIPPDGTPVSLLVEEYRLRRRHGDRPKLDEYRTRFPALADAFAEQLRKETALPPERPERPGTIGIEAADRSEDDRTKDVDRTPEAPRRSSRRSGSNAPRVDLIPTTDVLPAELEYKLGRRLGKGTFGEVYEALAPGGFPVAVKKILREVDHPASQGEVEALDAMKAMSHPFLVQTHAYWVFRDRLIIVMELAEGSLANRIQFHKGRGLPGVPPEELIPYTEQAADALDYLHSQHVSHRDVKPENLLVLKGYAKVADFGLAREHLHSLTLVGAEVGTPMYMAPEVWSRKVSLHSDQYSLAATYIAARLGRPIFDVKLLPELCYHHLHETPTLDPLPPAEQQVLLKALAKKPEDRYPSCVAFAKALRKAVLEVERPQRRTALWVGVAALLTFGVAGGLVAKFWPQEQPPVVGNQQPPPPPPPPPWVPANWLPVVDAGTKQVGDKVYHKRLTRNVGGEDLLAILITPTQPGDPPAFYMLRDKITNRAFVEAWKMAETNPSSRFSVLRVQNPELFPGVWREGAKRTTEEKPLGITGEQAAVPVVGMTVPEAIVVAAELGGQLPTYRQWLKAVGATGDGAPPGPAGSKEREKTLLKDPGEDLSQRPLALGLKDGPWPVARATKDVSVHGINQLVSNGYEWTNTIFVEGQEKDGPQVNLLDIEGPGYYVRLTGQPWENPYVTTFDRIPGQRDRAPWLNTVEMAGFRIVLTPK